MSNRYIDKKCPVCSSEMATNGKLIWCCNKECENHTPFTREDRCPCGGVILADTEDWKIPLCYSCWHELGEPKEEPK